MDNINSREFRKFIGDTELNELDYSGSHFTWCNNRSGMARVWERIDQALATAGWMHRFFV